MTAAIMWQRAINRIEGNRVADEVNTMEKNATHMMLAVEQQRMWTEPFYDESAKGIYRLR